MEKKVFVGMSPLELTGQALPLTGQTGGKRRKVFVGMSGGVDSSVAAALLKENGFNVTGVFIRVWRPDFLECTRTDDESMARRAAAHLGIPFLVFDFVDDYKREVVDYMVREYKRGLTPNPDVMCNRQIKFGSFLRKAREMGADFVATGHYARKEELEIKNQELRYKLLAGVDRNKDQSYFLWTLTQEQLRYILFPIGEYEKSKVREMARERGLPNAERKDSQGLCFVGEFPMRKFLEHFIPAKRGNVLSESGEVIGYHDGAFYFTIGQRHGFTITKKTPDDLPRYIVAKDIEKNTITVSTEKPDSSGNVSKVTLGDTNFIQGEMPQEGEIKVRYRYRQPLIEATLSGSTVHFKEEQGGVARGQSLVFYDGEKCLGGGIIVDNSIKVKPLLSCS